MPRYVVFNGAPTAADLYADWTSREAAFTQEVIEIRSTEVEETEDSNASLGCPTQIQPTQQSYIDMSVSVTLQPIALYFQVDRLTPLSSCPALLKAQPGDSLRLNVLGLVTALSPLESIKAKKIGAPSHKLLKVDLHDDSGAEHKIGKLSVVAWNAVAVQLAAVLKVYDIVYLQDILVAYDNYTKRVQAKTMDRTHFQVCYRMKASADEDQLYRPDVAQHARLGHGPAGRVDALVQFAEVCFSSSAKDRSDERQNWILFDE